MELFIQNSHEYLISGNSPKTSSPIPPQLNMDYYSFITRDNNRGIIILNKDTINDLSITLIPALLYKRSRLMS
jgi:hypothetical protein